MTWAFGLDLKPATAKFVLVALADNADDEGRAFPSVESLVAKTSLDRKTVIQALDQLERYEVLRDTGQRVGRTKQVKVYRLLKDSRDRAPFNEKSSAFGTVKPEAGTVPELPKDSVIGTVERVPKTDAKGTVFPSKGTVFPSKGSQKRYTEPSGNPQEPSGNRKSRTPTRARSRTVPEDFAITEEMRKWAKEAVPNVDIEAQTVLFRDHEFKDPHGNWPAAWRTWMRRAIEYQRSPARFEEPKLTWRPPPDEENVDAPR